MQETRDFSAHRLIHAHFDPATFQERKVIIPQNASLAKHWFLWLKDRKFVQSFQHIISTQGWVFNAGFSAIFGYKLHHCRFFGSVWRHANTIYKTLCLHKKANTDQLHFTSGIPLVETKVEEQPAGCVSGFCTTTACGPISGETDRFKFYLKYRFCWWYPSHNGVCHCL